MLGLALFLSKVTGTQKFMFVLFHILTSLKSAWSQHFSQPDGRWDIVVIALEILQPISFTYVFLSCFLNSDICQKSV